MNIVKSIRFFPVLLGLVAVSGLTACAHDPYYSSGPYERWPHHYHYPHYYDYYYYPSIGVYFHYSTGEYYYRSKKKWVRSRQLPPKFRLDPRDRVIIRVPSDKPYKRYDEHKREYKSYRDYRRDKDIDRKEREYNKRWHNEYLKREQKSKQERQYDKKRLR